MSSNLIASTMEAERIKGFYWKRKSLVYGDGYHIHHYWRFWSNPNETSEHPTNVFFLTEKKDLDLQKMGDKPVAILSKRRYDAFGKLERTERFCYSSYVFQRCEGRTRCELIAAAGSGHWEILLDLTNKHLKNLAPYYFKHDENYNTEGIGSGSQLVLKTKMTCQKHGGSSPLPSANEES